jgi:hypothetical protein
MENVAQPSGSQPYVASEQTTTPPLYLPNLIAAMVASVAVVIGSIGPWMTFMAFSRSNVDGDGMITLILGVVAAAALFAVFNLGRSRVDSGWMVALPCIAVTAGVISLVVAVVDIIEVNSRKAEFLGTTIGAQVGWGLWMVLIASLALIATASVVARQNPKLRGA